MFVISKPRKHSGTANLQKPSPWEGSRGPKVGQLFPCCPSRTGPCSQLQPVACLAAGAGTVEATKSVQSWCRQVLQWNKETQDLWGNEPFSRVDSCAERCVCCLAYWLSVLASYKRSRKGELSWFPVPTRPPLLAVARWPQRASRVHASFVCEYLRNSLQATVNVSVWHRDRRPRKGPACKNAAGVHFAMSLAPWLRPRYAILSMSLHHFAASWMIYLQR